MTAVIIELPFMLAASWIIAGRIIRWRNVAPFIAPRLVMGAVAFLLLIGAETVLGVAGFGREIGAQVAQYFTPAGAIGLAGQAAFGAIPALRLLTEK